MGKKSVISYWLLVISKFKTMAFAPQAKQYSSSRALRLLFKLSFLL